MSTSDEAEDQRFDLLVNDLMELVHRHFGGTMPAANPKEVADLLLSMSAVLAGLMVMCELKVGRGAAAAVKDRFITQLDRSYAEACAYCNSTVVLDNGALLRQLLEAMKPEGNG